MNLNVTILMISDKKVMHFLGASKVAEAALLKVINDKVDILDHLARHSQHPGRPLGDILQRNPC